MRFNPSFDGEISPKQGENRLLFDGQHSDLVGEEPDAFQISEISLRRLRGNLYGLASSSLALPFSCRDCRDAQITSNSGRGPWRRMSSP